MRLKKEHIERISKLIFANLTKKDLIIKLVADGEIVTKINEVISNDMLAEAKLEEDVRKLMDQYRQQIESGQLDERKTFLMIKKQLAKERKMVL